MKLSYAIIAAISVASGLSLTCAGLHAQTAGEAADATAEDAFGSITLNQAAAYFAEFKEACEQRRAAELWGVEVHGPVLLIDPTTRNVIANQTDPPASCPWPPACLRGRRSRSPSRAHQRLRSLLQPSSRH